MKKFIWLIVGTLILFSCEREEFDAFDESSKSGVQTRATSSIADFYPILELEGIPVNIMNVGNTRNKYLSCVAKGTKVDLYNKDDGSLRQRWYVGWNIRLVGGNTNPHCPNCLPYVSGPFTSLPPPILIYSDIPLTSFFFGLDGPFYHIGFINSNISYLQSNSTTGSDLSYKETKSGNLALWEFVPVGEYEIVDLQYVRTSVDNITPKEVICARDEYQNSSSSTVTWDYTVTTKYSESSNFSKAEGVSTTISAGLHVGLPNLLGKDGILDFNTSIQQQSNKSWNYGNSSTREVTETRTGHIPVPANTTMRLEATIVMYEGNVTYVATLRKIGDNKTFRVKGKWTGTSFSMFKAKTYNVSTNASLGVYSLE